MTYLNAKNMKPRLISTSLFRNHYIFGRITYRFIRSTLENPYVEIAFKITISINKMSIGWTALVSKHTKDLYFVEFTSEYFR